MTADCNGKISGLKAKNYFLWNLDLRDDLVIGIQPLALSIHSSS